MQAYSDPTRETDAYALPDVEIWEADVWQLECSRGCGSFEVDGETIEARRPECYCPSCGYNSGAAEKSARRAFWYWFCLPGCMPDSEPDGPYETEADALAAARDI